MFIIRRHRGARCGPTETAITTQAMADAPKPKRFYWGSRNGRRALRLMQRAMPLFTNERGRVDWDLVAKVLEAGLPGEVITARACREKHQALERGYDTTRATPEERRRVLDLVHEHGGTNFAAVAKVYSAETGRVRSGDWVRNIYSYSARLYSRWAEKTEFSAQAAAPKARMPCGHLWKRHGPEVGFGCCRYCGRPYRGPQKRTNAAAG